VITAVSSSVAASGAHTSSHGTRAMRCRCDADALLSLGGASKMSPDPNAFKVLALFLFFTPFSRKKEISAFCSKTS
jgi:hypothetical protein